MSKAKKQKVYIVSCPETELGNVYITGGFNGIPEGVGPLIEGDIENNPGENLYHYTVKIKMMTQKQIDELPEYEG